MGTKTNHQRLEQIMNLHEIRKRMGEIEFYGDPPLTDEKYHSALLFFFESHELFDELCKKYPLPL